MSDLFRGFNFRERHAVKFNSPSVTQQSFAAECDINRIVARYDASGIMPEGRSGESYDDVTTLQKSDMTTLLNKSMSTSLQFDADMREYYRAKEAQFKDEYKELKERVRQFEEREAASESAESD